jgi:hypothetical protein
LNVVGRDPDECLSDIPYEKGSLWLWKVERAVGREKMDAFLKKYFDDHAFKTISTEEFLAYLQEHLIKGDTALEQKLNIDAWIYGPGIPADAPRANGERFAKVDAARNAFLKDGSASGLSVNGWSTHEWLHFLRKMPNTLTLQQMSALDGTFHFTNTGNSEIADLWYIMAVRAQYKQAFTAMENFASRVGRQKFLLPLYEALVKNNQAALAKKMYKTYKMNYHPLTQTKIEKLVR